MKTITREQAAKLIRSIKGNRAFTVEFTKKSDGTVRKLNAILKCTKHLKNGKSTIAHKPELIGCYDMQTGGYRSFDYNTLLSLKMNGQEYRVI